MEWQNTVSNWIGKDLNKKSNRILHEGILTKTDVANTSVPNSDVDNIAENRLVTLFELQIIICKTVSQIRIPYRVVL